MYAGIVFFRQLNSFSYLRHYNFLRQNINITTNKLFRWFFSTIGYARKQGLELISVREMKIVFRSFFHNITFKHYLEKPKPMIETILNKKICNNPKLIEVLTQIHSLVRI